MSIGDVHSNARGSGARFNDGKVPLHLIPLRLIADSFTDTASDVETGTALALAQLGDFQTTGNAEYLDLALEVLPEYWRDCAAVFEYGRRKYAEWNWAKGMPWSVPLACAARHALAILEGEENDLESSLPHVGHLLCNLVMLRTYADSYPEGNDLPDPALFAARGAAMPPSPDYDPASVAFRHGEDIGWLGELPKAGTNVPKTAYEIAAADGCAEYGNPITPGCAPWRLP